tara:strand:+ start:1880 stop:2542 length:663 start_codon:yes stop_codon:yes gene_type:complete
MLEKYKDKNLLILGAGQSTIDVNWKNLDYDYIWTCNDFFICDELLDDKIDLCVLGYTQDLYDERLVSRVLKDKTLVMIEPLHYREKIHSMELEDFTKKVDVYKMDIPSDRNLAGAAARLVSLGLLVEAKNVYFAGLDGFNKDFSNFHAFTKHVGLKDTDTRREWKIYYDGFIKCFKYYLNFDYSRLQNLGEGYDYNIGTEISKEYFPLRKEVKEAISEKN